MKILHFTNKPIYPVIDGGCVAMKNTLDLLSVMQGENEIVHFTLATHKHPFNKGTYPKNRKYTLYFQEIDTTIKTLDLIKSLKAFTPYNVQRFFDSSVVETLQDIIELHKIEVVLLESIYLLPYLKHLHKVKVIVRTHNIEWKLWQDRAKGESNWLKKIYSKHLSQQLKNYESVALRNVDHVLSISNSDAEWFEKLLPNTSVLQTSIEVSTEPANYELNDFYFLGAADWPPNLEALNWLLTEVLAEKNFDFQIHIAGKNLDPKLYKDHPNVTNHGEINNADVFIKNHGIALIPLQTGGGVKMKVLEALKHGKPCITTNEGMRGLTLKNQENVLVANSAKEFLEAMKQLNQNESLRKAIGEGGKRFLNDNFAPDKEAQKLFEIITNI